MIEPTRVADPLQAKLLELSRSSVYYRPRPTSDADLALMRRIDELHLEHLRRQPDAARLLRQDGIAVVASTSAR